MKNWTGVVEPVVPLEVPGPIAEDSEADLGSHPFIEDAGGAVGTDDDSLTNPEFILESDIVARLVRENFESETWLNRSNTVWEAYDGVYIVMKANDRINMPALDG